VRSIDRDDPRVELEPIGKTALPDVAPEAPYAFGVPFFERADRLDSAPPVRPPL